MSDDESYRKEFAEWLAEPSQTHALLVGCADALIAIVAQPWPEQSGYVMCPYCLTSQKFPRHFPDCAWLIAARALGIA